ncbi:uncharacterized protein [Nicotiana tomentosiformis]|uniref:uncharacterized protein n=1 Tax=Nicotiana tomentosiformis TaxID=4098 RepID=UPI00388C3CA8
MTVSKYAVWFNELSRYEPALVSTIRKRIRQFIEGLCPGIRFRIARELETDIPYQQGVEIAQRLEGISRDSLSSPIYVSTSVGDSFIVDRVYQTCLVILGGFETRANLMLLSFPRLEWRGTLDYVPSKMVSFLKAHRMVGKGCEAYLAFVRNTSVDTPTVESAPVVRDYPNVSLADLPSMLPDRDIDFGIDLLSGTQPISIPLYRMAPAELMELKE